MSLVNRCFCSIIVPLLLCAAGAAAQAPGGPIVEIPAANPRFGVLADFARGELLPAAGVVRSWGATGLLGLGSVSLSAGGAVVDADSADSGWSAHGGLAPELCAAFRPASIDGRFHLCDLLPGILALRARVGVTYAALEVGAETARVTEGTVGLALAVQAPTPFMTAELWLAPRLQVRYANPAANRDDEGATRVGGGATLGLAVTATSGLGLHATIDELWLEDPAAAGTSNRFAFGLGLHYIH